jgi:hypothetical protein
MVMVAFVPSPGTMAGVQLEAVFQLPLAAAAQEVCAALRSAKSKINVAGTNKCANFGKDRWKIVSKKFINAVFTEYACISMPWV